MRSTDVSLFYLPVWAVFVQGIFFLQSLSIFGFMKDLITKWSLLSKLKRNNLTSWSLSIWNAGPLTLQPLVWKAVESFECTAVITNNWPGIMTSRVKVLSIFFSLFFLSQVNSQIRILYQFYNIQIPHICRMNFITLKNVFFFAKSVSIFFFNYCPNSQPSFANLSYYDNENYNKNYNTKIS